MLTQGVYGQKSQNLVNVVCERLLGAKCKVKILLVIEIFFTLHRYCTITVQYWCSVSKAKHDQVFSATLQNGHKIQISLQPLDSDLTWRVASTTHWSLLVHYYFRLGRLGRLAYFDSKGHSLNSKLTFFHYYINFLVLMLQWVETFFICFAHENMKKLPSK